MWLGERNCSTRRFREKNAHLAFDEVTYPRFGHDGDRNGFHDFFNHARVGHTCHTALVSDICGNTLESHDGTGTCFFCYSCLEAYCCQKIWCKAEMGLRYTCSALTTSMITPPFIIFARPVFTVKFVLPLGLSPAGPCPLVLGMSSIIFAGWFKYKLAFCESALRFPSLGLLLLRRVECARNSVRLKKLRFLNLECLS